MLRMVQPFRQSVKTAFEDAEDVEYAGDDAFDDADDYGDGNSDMMD